MSLSVEKTEPGKSIKRNLKNFSKYLDLAGVKQFANLVKCVKSVMEKPDSRSLRTNHRAAEMNGDCRGLTVISANLWHDWPQYRRALDRLEAFARLAEAHHADILLLQEVFRTPDLQADDWLSHRLGMSSIYSRANGSLSAIGFEEGLAILSRFPLSRPVLNRLSTGSKRFSYRLALGSHVETPCGSLMAFSAHLSINPKHNVGQAGKLQDWVQRLTPKLPGLVGGDFNAGEQSDTIRSLRQSWVDTFHHLNPYADGTTHEIRWPWGKPLRRSRLDYIFLKAEQAQWKLLEALHLETPGKNHSDHRAVLLRLAPESVKVSSQR